MSRETAPARALTFTATTLVALVAMSAAVAAEPVQRTVAVEGRTESHVVRAVAAAVAAAARDLFVGESVALPVLEVTPEPDRGPAASLRRDRERQLRPACLLDERQLDLPPPAC